MKGKGFLDVLLISWLVCRSLMNQAGKSLLVQSWLQSVLCCAPLEGNWSLLSSLCRSWQLVSLFTRLAVFSSELMRNLRQALVLP